MRERLAQAQGWESASEEVLRASRVLLSGFGLAWGSAADHTSGAPVSRALWAGWHLPGSKDSQERLGVQHRHPGESCLESYPFSRKMAKPLGPLLRL